MNKPNILVISHGHPFFNKGGAEVCAYNIYKAYSKSSLTGNSFFLFRKGENSQPSGAINFYQKNEYSWDSAIHDWTSLKAANRLSSLKQFQKWLKFIDPHIVHVHHYAHMGIEIFRVIKQTCPRAILLFTLHEYMAICKNNGQFIDRNNQTLCTKSSINTCQVCFPELSRQDFWLRKEYILNNFSFVDIFIAPSNFLRLRYIDWGIDPKKIFFIENGQVDAEEVPPRDINRGEQRNRFAFFGQINPYKGIDILLEAFRLVAKTNPGAAFLEIHGANLEIQSQDFQDKINKLRKYLINKNILFWGGRYEQNNLPSLYKNIDWVVVPSIWWENSPVVINESFMYKRPLIVSSIGGMAEMVTDNHTGLYFSPKNANELADKILFAASHSEVWDKLYNNIKKPVLVEQTVETILEKCSLAKCHS